MPLSEKQYHEICNACNELLMATDSTLERVAIPWLHIIREHPIVLARYKELFADAGILGEWRWRLKLGLLNKAVWLRQIFRAVKSSGMDQVEMDGAPDRVDLLFVSYLLKPSQFNDANDFYFASLPAELAQEGLSAAVAMINSTEKSAAYFHGQTAGGRVPRLILGESLSLKDEWNFHKRLRAESRRLALRARQARTPLERRVALRASLEALSNGAHHALRLENQIASLIQRIKPRALVVLHEGHAWERTAFAAARRVDHGVVCIGYQHSLIFRLQYAIRQQLPPQYMPDWIMASGDVGKCQLETASALRNVPIRVLGSIRAPRLPNGDAAKSQIGKSRNGNQNFSCLVLPEGLPTECDLLFEFSIECAKLCPDLKFIWRLHPLVTFKSLAARNPKLRKLPGNIHRSEEPFEKDLASCKLALYRGTSAIVQALGAGLRPVYLRLPGEMTIDPLYQIPAWRIEIETPKEFQELVCANAAANEEEERRIAMNFCEQMFLPINRSALAYAILQSETGRRNPKNT